MEQLQPRSNQTFTHFPYTTMFRSRCTAEECEGLRQHEREIDRQQRLKLRGGGGRRVFPDAEDAAKSAAIGIAHLHRLAAEDDALTIERAAEVPPDDRNPAMPSRHHHFRDFHRLRTLKAIMSVDRRSEEKTSELQSLMGISYAVFC